MHFKKGYREFSRLMEYVKNFSLLLARMAVAYGFYIPSEIKWADPEAIAIWFASMGVPFPLFTTYMVSVFETMGIILLSLGLFTRLISFPLIIIMITAIFTVHIGHGFSAAEHGFEIPLYYMLFLFVFLTHGAGRYSLDQLFFGKEEIK
ncbi:MAG: DoxX family protein [Epsilonproteobacteria bacterium]|nr:MAG: DoxX family protein [Campylobacterota bacterium]